MKPSVIVWDLETVPLIAAHTAPHPARHALQSLNSLGCAASRWRGLLPRTRELIPGWR